MSRDLTSDEINHAKELVKASSEARAFFEKNFHVWAALYKERDRLWQDFQEGRKFPIPKKP
jgi:hypothetical protein